LTLIKVSDCKYVHYYYQQTIELLFQEKPSKEDLIDALSDISAEYGYVYARAYSGQIENAAPQLDRFKLVIDKLKLKIKHYKD